MPLDERRYFGLDALRGFMMMLGIVLHGAMLYLTAPPPAMPIPTDRNNAFVFDLIFDFIHAFRMPTFFVLAGFFTSLLVDKRGVGGTYKNRVSRILLPLLAALVLILPITGILMADFMLGARFGTHDLIPNRAHLLALSQEIATTHGMDAARPMIGHLWFLYYLCMFYLLIPVCRWAIARSRGAEGRFSRWIGGPLAPLAFALWTALTLWPFRGGQVHEGFVYFVPHPPSLLYYGSFFVFGYVFHTYREFLQATMRFLPAAAMLGACLFPLSLMASALDNGAGGGSAALHLVAVVTNALCTWALIYLFIGSALRFFDRQSPWIDYVSQSSYWVFLVHMPLVALAGWWLLQYNWPAGVKFTLVCGFTSVVAFASFHFWVQNTWVSAFLHGRRLGLKWPWKTV